MLEVSAYLGISVDYYSEIEQGIKKPSHALLNQLASYYNIPPRVTVSKERLIINVNSGPGSNSNSGCINQYINDPKSVVIEQRLTEIEKLLQQIISRI